MKKLKIAILTNCHKEHPSPKGSIFAPGVIATQLADGLFEKGHNVDFYAPMGSKTKANLIDLGIKSVYAQFYKKYGLDSAKYAREHANADILNFTEAIDRYSKGQYDIVHSHDIRNGVFVSTFADKAILYTMHTVVNSVDLSQSYKYALKLKNNANKFICISKKQKQIIDKGLFRVAGVVSNGIDMKKFGFKNNNSSHALFVGRITPEKGADIAVEACLKAKKRLVLIGDIPNDKISKDFWRKKIEPHVGKLIEYCGHKSPDVVKKYYQQAELLIFSSRAEESFGLSIIESLACGTPVISFDKGVASEAIINNFNGFIVKNKKDIVKFIPLVKNIKRKNCRDSVLQKFSIQSMVDNYEKIYLDNLS